MSIALSIGVKAVAAVAAIAFLVYWIIESLVDWRRWR